jgi:hypothetical protein
MDGDDLSAVRAAMLHFHPGISHKNIIPGALILDWGAGTDFRFETASRPFGGDGGIAEEPRRSFSNPDANRLRPRLLRLQISSLLSGF